MKNIIAVLFVLLISGMFGSSCKRRECPDKKPSGFTNAIITGNDMRKCACCGGFMITFSKDATPYSAEFSLINSLPKNSGITESSEFPVYVRVKYSTASTTCGNKLDIQELQLR